MILLAVDTTVADITAAGTIAVANPEVGTMAAEFLGTRYLLL
jgi:hypothetical protein